MVTDPSCFCPAGRTRRAPDPSPGPSPCLDAPHQRGRQTWPTRACLRPHRPRRQARSRPPTPDRAPDARAQSRTHTWARRPRFRCAAGAARDDPWLRALPRCRCGPWPGRRSGAPAGRRLKEGAHDQAHASGRQPRATAVWRMCACVARLCHPPTVTAGILCKAGSASMSFARKSEHPAARPHVCLVCLACLACASCAEPRASGKSQRPSWGSFCVTLAAACLVAPCNNLGDGQAGA